MQLDALQELALRISGERDIERVLQHIIDGLRQQPGVALARIWIVGPGDLCEACRLRSSCPDRTACLHLAASAGTSLSGESWSRTDGSFRRIPIGALKVGTIAASRTGRLLADPASEWWARPDWVHSEAIRAFAGHPLAFGDETLGVLAVFTRTPIDEQEFRWLRMLADQAASAIINARAFSELEQLAGRLIHAQEEERRRIGRELHDDICQRLTVVSLQIDQLRAEGEAPTDPDAVLDHLRQDLGEIASDVHRLSHRLHASTIDYLGLASALQNLVSEFSERHHLTIAFTHASMPSSLPSDVALCLFRVAEESLTNMAKHSHARSARVHAVGEPDGIRLTVDDEGTGFDVTSQESKAGLGLVSMRERLRALDGSIHIDSAPSRGTKVEAWVPSTRLGADEARQARLARHGNPR